MKAIIYEGRTKIHVWYDIHSYDRAQTDRGVVLYQDADGDSLNKIFIVLAMNQTLIVEGG